MSDVRNDTMNTNPECILWPGNKGSFSPLNLAAAAAAASKGTGELPYSRVSSIHTKVYFFLFTGKRTSCCAALLCWQFNISPPSFGFSNIAGFYCFQKAFELIPCCTEGCLKASQMLSLHLFPSLFFLGCCGLIWLPEMENHSCAGCLMDHSELFSPPLVLLPVCPHQGCKQDSCVVSLQLNGHVYDFILRKRFSVLEQHRTSRLHL